jgi:gas vesicle protein
VSEQTRVCAGAILGALVGAAAAYLFYTDRGRVLRDRIEPAVDDVRREFMRFQKTIEKVGDLANDGLRVVNEFNMARAQTPFPTEGTSH